MTENIFFCGAIIVVGLALFAAAKCERDTKIEEFKYKMLQIEKGIKP